MHMESSRALYTSPTVSLFAAILIAETKIVCGKTHQIGHDMEFIMHDKVKPQRDF